MIMEMKSEIRNVTYYPNFVVPNRVSAIFGQWDTTPSID
jgi:hypothetical protein